MRKSTKFTNEYVSKKLLEKNILLHGEYKGDKHDIIVECINNDCKKIWTTRFSRAIKHGCSKCNRKRKIIEREKMFDDLLKIKNKIRRIGPYVNNEDPIACECIVVGCGHKWPISYDNVKGGYGCPKCAGTLQYTTQTFAQKLLDEEIEVEILGEYTYTKTPTLFRCKNCKNEWMARPNNIIRFYGCPECHGYSKEERKVGKLIEKYVKYNYYKPHKTFRFNNRYYFPDFYLEIGNKKIIIERQGEQHYMPVDFGRYTKLEAETAFFHNIIRDNEMRWYCDENNIILLEIPYWWKKKEIIEELKDLNQYNIVNV
jgi:hypothetical protein